MEAWSFHLDSRKLVFFFFSKMTMMMIMWKVRIFLFSNICQDVKKFFNSIHWFWKLKFSLKKRKFFFCNFIGLWTSRFNAIQTCVEKLKDYFGDWIRSVRRLKFSLYNDYFSSFYGILELLNEKNSRNWSTFDCLIPVFIQRVPSNCCKEKIWTFKRLNFYLLIF